MLWFTSGMVVLLGLLTLVPFYLLFTHLAAASTWEKSAAGRLHAEALGSWLLAKARIEGASPVDQPPIVRSGYVGRLVGGRSRRVFVQEERRAVHLAVQILPIGGGEVRSEGVVTIPTAELGELAPGRIFTVLYDPRDPRRFYVDTMHRDRILLDAATMRTREAEENLRAQLAFSPMGGQQYRG